MGEYRYISLREKPELKTAAADWFHSKWGVPTEAYLEWTLFRCLTVPPIWISR